MGEKRTAVYDSIIKGGMWFDGTGAPPALRNLGIRDGRVTTLSTDPLDESGCDHVVDAAGKWVIPGMLDIHTHYDVEVLLDPALSESVRHGVTTVLIGSCSLSTVHVDPETAGDIFGRVEAIPRAHVIDAVAGAKTWRSAHDYAAALDALPLGPNIASFLGHSDIRAAEMGLDRATRAEVKPTAGELTAMRRHLEEALDAGFVGMSSQQLLFDKLDGDTCRSRTLPSTYASMRERHQLNSILRSRRRALQGGPDVSRPQSLVTMGLSSLGVGQPNLKVSLLSAADIKAIPVMAHLFPVLARTVNALGGDFRFQQLPVPFEVYADGIDLVIFEEFGSGAEALHLADQLDRRHQLLQDTQYRRRFRKDYDHRYGPRVWHRDLFDAEIVDCPDESVIGKTFGQIGVERGGVHPADAFLDLVVEYGAKVRWRTTISNHRPHVLNRFAVDPGMQLGFSDAGAHLRNMAFYNFGLRLLRRVRDAQQAGRPFMTVEHAVHRLTGELADWYGIDAGRLRVGDRADVVVIDPERLDDELDRYAEQTVPCYGNLSRMVNRNDAAVNAVFVNGRRVFGDGVAAPGLGSARSGRFLAAS
ncbi:N-acyl-D-amino-acid deacylase family protein [Nocardia vermiculata]|uniref:Amidohydrolase family protein n=1 Tax=Nocardia vermiculata TaxID=257274 RepID=A0A846Y3E4_9NOCA|nr:amidohydrolase family protein [Nocardia vermiculata]NKY52211.1 amidohydrolase family protein [Nocardia vermiculata]